MATKRVMATDGDTTENGHGKEGKERSTMGTMTMGMGTGTAQGTWPLALLLETGGSWWQ